MAGSEGDVVFVQVPERLFERLRALINPSVRHLAPMWCRWQLAEAVGRLERERQNAANSGIAAQGSETAAHPPVGDVAQRACSSVRKFYGALGENGPQTVANCGFLDTESSDFAFRPVYDPYIGAWEGMGL